MPCTPGDGWRRKGKAGWCFEKAATALPATTALGQFRLTRLAKRSAEDFKEPVQPPVHFAKRMVRQGVVVQIAMLTGGRGKLQTSNTKIQRSEAARVLPKPWDYDAAREGL